MRELNSKQTLQNRDRVLGCMVGGAVGDALGYAVEFSSWPQIRSRYGERGITRFELDRRGVAPISDDTQMSLFTAAGILLGMTRGSMRGIMGRIDTYCWYSYQDWLKTQELTCRPKKDEYENDGCHTWLMDVPELYVRRAPGKTCLSALRAEASRNRAENDSCGCGGVMRTAPLALLNYIHGYAGGNAAYCDMCAAEAARITHKHPLGFIPSAILNHMLMDILAGLEDRTSRPEYFVERALRAIPEVVSEVDFHKTYGELWPQHLETQKTLVVKALDLAYSDMPDPLAIESIGGGWTGHEALAIAIYSAVKHKDSFEEAIISSVNHSGDSDSTGAICGNIMGCLLGRSAIPAHYTENLEMLSIIEEMGEDLFTGCIISEYDEINTPEKQRWYEKYCCHHWIPSNE